jgi:uncharacterized protein YbjT (DUF2867 family)
MPKFVVAGVTGRVGRAAAEELLAGGVQPTVIVRSEARAAEWRHRGAEAAVGSLDDETFVARTLDGADGFFTLLPENVDPADFHGARRRMADAMAGGVHASGVPHVVMHSAVIAVLPAGNGPAADLHYLEDRLRIAGTTLSALRASYLQDNVRELIPAARQAGICPTLMPSADVAFPMIAAKDAGRFAARALIGPPASSEIVDLFGPAYSIRDVANRLGAALGRRLDVVTVPPERHVAALMDAGVPRQLAEAVAEMFAAVAAGFAPGGSRQEHGTTTIDEVIDATLRSLGIPDASDRAHLI